MFLLGVFSSREPVPTSLEIALAAQWDRQVVFDPVRAVDDLYLAAKFLPRTDVDHGRSESWLDWRSNWADTTLPPMQVDAGAWRRLKLPMHCEPSILHR